MSTKPTLTSARINSKETVPVEADARRSPSGWDVRVVLRADRVDVRKEVFVLEEVLIRKDEQVEQVSFDESVRLERLKVGTEGNPPLEENESKD